MARGFELFTHVTDRDVPFAQEDTVRVYRGADRQIYWQRKAYGNNEVMADGSQGYDSEDDARTGALRVNRGPFRLVIEVD